ncbi:MAG TPA: hypothetical protein VFO44_17935 [Steroidobacteraceae bacterium]|nr:hypothetical protein [Steroidobacteraceae bacterium]
MTFECGRARGGASTVLRLLAGGLLAGLALIESGCGNTTFTYGTPVMVVSGSAPGPFSAYIAGIMSIVFNRNDGTPVEPIILVNSAEEFIDFANLTDMHELMGSPAAVTGTYTSATVTLDYSSAQIFVNVNGTPTSATVVDDAGNPVTTVSYNVTFDPAHPLVLTQYVSNLVDINFDLSASSIVGQTSKGPQVQVKPILTISTAPIENKPIRARGLFVTANPGASNYIINSLPFFDTTAPQGFGALTVQITPQTTFSIDGVTYTGTAGLTQLQKLNGNLNASLVTAYGTFGSLNNVTPTFNATQVYAGSSLESPDEDTVRGIVSSRSGNTVHIKGVTVFDRLGGLGYQASLTMTVGNDTLVSIDGAPSNAGVSAKSISVGQEITAAGALAPVAPAGVYTSLDATAGLVRLMPATVWGTLNAGAARSSASIGLIGLGIYQPSVFSFAGTGTSSSLDAKPATYIVDTGSTDESATPAGTLLRADGLVSPFGGAPPDFVATTLTPEANLEQALVIDWAHGGSKSPFLSMNDTGLVVNIKSPVLGTSHVVQTGPFNLDLRELQVSPLIVPDPSVTGQFAIGNPSTGINEFNSFSAFLTQIEKVLNGTNALQKLVAIGHYDSATGTFKAYRIDLVPQ